MAGTVPFLVAFIVKDCFEFSRFLLNIRSLGEELVERRRGNVLRRLDRKQIGGEDGFSLVVDAVKRELVEMVMVAEDKLQVLFETEAAAVA